MGIAQVAHCCGSCTLDDDALRALFFAELDLVRQSGCLLRKRHLPESLGSHFDGKTSHLAADAPGGIQVEGYAARLDGGHFEAGCQFWSGISADAAVSCRIVLAADAPAGSCFPGPGRDLPCEKRSALYYRRDSIRRHGAGICAEPH